MKLSLGCISAASCSFVESHALRKEVPSLMEKHKGKEVILFKKVREMISLPGTST